MATQTYRIMDIYSALDLARQESVRKYSLESPDNAVGIARDVERFLSNNGIGLADITTMLREGKHALRENEIFKKLPFRLMLGCIATAGEKLHRQASNTFYVIPDHLDYAGAGSDGGFFQANVLGINMGLGGKVADSHERKYFINMMLSDDWKAGMEFVGAEIYNHVQAAEGKERIIRALRSMRDIEARTNKHIEETRSKRRRIVLMTKEDVKVLTKSPLTEEEIAEILRS